MHPFDGWYSEAGEAMAPHADASASSSFKLTTFFWEGLFLICIFFSCQTHYLREKGTEENLNKRPRVWINSGRFCQDNHLPKHFIYHLSSSEERIAGWEPCKPSLDLRRLLAGGRLLHNEMDQMGPVQSKRDGKIRDCGACIFQRHISMLCVCLIHISIIGKTV